MFKKLIITAATIVSFFLGSTAYAKDEICAAFMEFVYITAEARYNGVTYTRALTNASAKTDDVVELKVSRITQRIVTYVYDLPRYRDKTKHMAEVSELANAVYIACFERFNE